MRFLSKIGWTGQISLTMLIVLLAATAVLAGSNGTTYDLSRNVIGGGGATFSTFEVGGTIGQFAVTGGSGRCSAPGLPRPWWSPATAGTASDVTVTAVDSVGSTKTDYTGTVTFASSDPAATMPDSYAFVSGDSGTHTFTGAVTLKTAGEQFVTVTDQADQGITGTLSGITVSPAAAAQLVVSVSRTR